MTSPLMKFTLQDRDTLHELDQPLKELAYVSNHWGPLLSVLFRFKPNSRFDFDLACFDAMPSPVLGLFFERQYFACTISPLFFVGVGRFAS